jgi:hypothetical protein
VHDSGQRGKTRGSLGRELSFRVRSSMRDTEGTNQRRCSCPRHPYRWRRRRPFSHSECLAWVGGYDAALLGVHRASEAPARGILVHAWWRNDIIIQEDCHGAKHARC